ncbi:hypothetical protein JHK85_017662 [Glycine max]|nr:hypothetical protein JHK85_017662 [Glycine max]
MASNSAAEGVSMGDDYEALIATTDAELLKRAWRNEKAAPEILRYESDLVSRVKKVIQFLEETVEEKSSGGTNPLSVSLYQMDLDRTLFLLRSYLRIRIQKVRNCNCGLLLDIVGNYEQMSTEVFKSGWQP